MRTITTTTNVYKFEELSPESQANALDKYREWMTDDPYWYTCETEYHKDLLTEQGIVKPEIYFSGFWNQGDGAVFECKSIDLIKLINSLGIKDEHKFIYDLLTDDKLDVSAGIARTSNYYSHERTARLTIDLYWLGSDEHEDTVLEKLKDLENELEQWRIDYCKEIYNALQSEYETIQSDDVLKEHFVENEYEFLEDGTMYN